ncbi:MAG: PAS domain S-box protein [Gemmatimonadota bacterium]
MNESSRPDPAAPKHSQSTRESSDSQMANGLDPRRLLAAIVEWSDDAILGKDLEGVITSWNSAAERLYGYTPAEAVGRHVSMLTPSEEENDVPELMRRLRRGERIRHYETIRMTRGGKRLNVALTISPIKDDAGRVVGASTIARDITRMKREERRWRLLSEMSQALGSVLDAERLLRDLSQLLVPELADYCVTYIAVGGQIRRIGTAHAEVEMEPVLNRLLSLSPPTLEDAAGAGAVMRTGEAILAEDISEDALRVVAPEDEYYVLLKRLGPVSSMVLPLRARDRTVGAIALALTERSTHRYSGDDLGFAKEVASRAALALDNVRLFQEARSELRRREQAEAALRRRFEQLRVVYEITEAVGQASALEEIYRLALDGLRRGLTVDRASVLLFDSHGVMRFQAWSGISEGYREEVDGHSPWSADTTDPEALVIADVGADEDLAADLRETILSEGIRAMAFIPLVSRGQLLGKFMLYFDAPHEFQADELELSRTIAGTVAFAISRVRDEWAIREAKEEAEAANAAKAQFLGVMSHELRTPLNAIGGYVELLELGIHGEPTAAQRRALERIRTNQRHLLGLINDILSFAKLEAGQVEIVTGPCSVAEILTGLEALVSPLASAKDIECTLSGADDLFVLADDERLNQILLNLVANAIKFAPRGGWVRLTSERVRDEVLIRVQDNGPGIAPEKQGTIFEPFVQADRSLHFPQDGVGLGLAISRELARGMNGELEVESEPPNGAAFTLRLAAAPAA